jgi:rifampicin phosphotransferase
MIVTSYSKPEEAKAEAGGKGYSLYRLEQTGVLVPKWQIAGISVFDRFWQDARLDRVLAKGASQVHQVILNTPLDRASKDVFLQMYHSFDGKRLAVRSSAQDEDGSQYSYAGMFDSVLGIKNAQEALKAVAQVWASAYSKRAIEYRTHHQRSLGEPVKMAVIFQEMIESEVSGVLFTQDPTSYEQDRMLIQSVYGLGEGLVTHGLEADTYQVDATGFTIKKQTIALKATAIATAPLSGHIEEVSVPHDHQHLPSLAKEDVISLSKTGAAIAKSFEAPQDIEWAMADGTLYVLQARPITTSLRSQGTLHIWDNSNIVESYGGITLPLTFTFARHVYHQVYIQFCELLGVTQKQVRDMPFLAHMLGSFKGRIYYNLLNWYALTSILPGYRFNRSFMEGMMGTQTQLQAEIAERSRAPVSHNGLQRIRIGLTFVYHHFVIQTTVDDFLRYFHQVYQRYRKMNYAAMNISEILTHYSTLEKTLLRQWKAPILNDFLCMVHFGLLKKLTQRWLHDLSMSLQNDLLCGEGNLESAQPTKELMTIASVAKKTPALMKLLITVPAEDALHALRASEYRDFTQAIEAYIDRYGFRCMNEMKLEQKDLYQDPSFLFICLKQYLTAKLPTVATMEKREQRIRKNAEKVVITRLKGWKRWVYFWSLHHTRKAVRNRENTRFCRTRIYGVVRTWFYHIGRNAAEMGIIRVPEDIFYLELDEVLGFENGTLTIETLSELIRLRKHEYADYAKEELPSRFITRGPAYWNIQPAEAASPASTRHQGEILGTGCSPGIVKARACVMLTPGDKVEFTGKILITMRTDPGWIPLYPLLSGLVVERGSLLSHSAVVAREMGIPTIVGVPDVTKKIADGMMIEINGESGKIRILT